MTKPRVAKHAVIDAHRHDPADADADAFAKEMQDVARLEPDLRGRAVRTPRAGSLPAMRSVIHKPVEETMDGPLAAFAAPGIDRRELKRLKRGDYGADGHLDLHGMTAAQACARVERFLETSRHRGHRSVCIVHGRGLHSEAGVAVLKTRVRDYLRAHPSVLAYSDAPQSAGGAGAVYVLLRK